jgi:hypothetical protein
MHALLAVDWQPELRGLLTVIIAVATLCGSVYLVLGTNLGARLGLQVALAGLFGWLMLMGIVWWIYGIGLKGPEPSWQPVAGRAVMTTSEGLAQAQVLDVRIDSSGVPADDAAAVEAQFLAEGWVALEESSPSFGQAGSAAGVIVEEVGSLPAGGYQVANVFDIGGERYPKLGDEIDFLAFFHKPHYVVVELAPLAPVRAEPGRAPAQAEIDPTRNHQYVYMVRDLGARRQPAVTLTFGAGIIFVALCWLLHRRDRFVAQNRSAAVVAAGS